MKHIFKVELESTNKNWHDVADELAKSAIESENSIDNIEVYLYVEPFEHKASRS